MKQEYEPPEKQQILKLPLYQKQVLLKRQLKNIQVPGSKTIFLYTEQGVALAELCLETARMVPRGMGRAGR